MLFLLLFVICGAPDPSAWSDRCEAGELRARSCDFGEAYLRDGLKPDQTLHISSCEAA